MPPTLIPLPPDVPAGLSASLQSFQDAISDLQNPGGPQQLAHVDTKANLAKYPADSYRGGFLICDEINSLVHSTAVAGVYAWLRVDGSAL